MRLFINGDGIPLALSLFSGSSNTSHRKPLEKVFGEFDCQKFIYCSNARQKTLRDEQIKCSQKCQIAETQKNRKYSNDPASFIGTTASAKEEETAVIHHYLDESKITKNTGMMNSVPRVWNFSSMKPDIFNILKVSEGRRQIKKCFHIMKTDFSAKPVSLQNEERITPFLSAQSLIHCAQFFR